MVRTLNVTFTISNQKIFLKFLHLTIIVKYAVSPCCERQGAPRLAVGPGQNQDDSECQDLQPDVITETGPRPPYGACSGHKSSNGDNTASYENFSNRAPPYDVVSKTACQ